MSNRHTPRRGTFWVTTHNHEIIADITDTRPEGKTVGARRYHDDLRAGIDAWGKYAGASWKVEKAVELVGLAAEGERTSFLECFTSFENDVPGGYLAVVFDNGSRAGRVWLMKTVVHTLTQVHGTHPLDLKGKTIYTHHFADFVDKSWGTGGKEALAPVCPVTFLQVPASGICECSSPECPYSVPV